MYIVWIQMAGDYWLCAPFSLLNPDHEAKALVFSQVSLQRPSPSYRL